MTIRLALLAIFLPMSAPHADAAGLSTTMGRVFIKNVPVGSTVSVNGFSGMSYKVTNTSRNPEEVLVSVLNPTKDEGILIDGYEPLPSDVSVTLGKDKFDLAPGQQGASDILIYIPKDEKHLEKRYQVSIWARNAPKGRLLAVGLKSRLMITVAPTLKSMDESKAAEKIIEDLNFHLTPFEMSIENVPVGHKVDAEKEFDKKFRIINLSDKKFTVRLKRARQASSGLGSLPGVVDDVGQIRGLQEKIVIEPNSIGMVPFTIEVPADERFYGKKIRFILEAELEGYAIPVSAYGQVFVTTQNKESKQHE